MTAEVKVLIEGYDRKENEDEFASSTAVLIKENGLNIIVDPGIDRKLLMKSLKKEDLSPDKINYIILTHHHIDHALLSGIFEYAKAVDAFDIWSWDGKAEKHNGRIPKTSLEIISTPGHSSVDCSVLIKDEKSRKIAIVGDVFWWADKENQNIDYKNLINKEDSYAADKEALLKSRKKVLDMADYVIPGHGKMFEARK